MVYLILPIWNKHYIRQSFDLFFHSFNEFFSLIYNKFTSSKTMLRPKKKCQLNILSNVQEEYLFWMIHQKELKNNNRERKIIKTKRNCDLRGELCWMLFMYRIAGGRSLHKKTIGCSKWDELNQIHILELETKV